MLYKNPTRHKALLEPYKVFLSNNLYASLTLIISLTTRGLFMCFMLTSEYYRRLVLWFQPREIHQDLRRGLGVLEGNLRNLTS